MNRKLTCSIGIMAYNEEANIGYLLDSVNAQRLVTCDIRQVAVVASGCTDRTVEIVRSYAASNQKVRLLLQEKREGKAAAINMFLRQAEGDIVILESGDTILEPDTIENLVRPFFDSTIGMTGARPVPLNPSDSFIGFTVNLYWRLHHEVAKHDPKLGEIIAFRNTLHEIPPDTAVDEASIEAMILGNGFRIYYASDAIVRNKGAMTIRDYLKQRRRVEAGHKHLQATRGYQVSTMKLRNLVHLAGLLVKETPRNVRAVSWTIGAVVLEMFGRALGDWDYYILKRNPFVWDIAQSTKNLRNDSASS